MEYINKSSLQLSGESIIVYFLKKLKEFGANYPKDLYETFKSAKNDNDIFLQELLTAILLEEQNNRCCYCMRNLEADDEEKTLEHLIPNKGLLNKQHFERYLNDDTILNERNLCYAQHFIDNEEVSYPPFPHTIAYQNLSVSCNGKYFRTGSSAHCNLFRGKKDIIPCIIFDTINDDVEYKSNGFVIWTKETEPLPSFDKLGLNDNILKMIRRIWFYANKKDINPLELSPVQRDELLYAIISEINDKEFDILLNFKNDVFWNKFKKYDYFSKYNIKKIAKQLVNMKPKELCELLWLLSSLIKIG